MVRIIRHAADAAGSVPAELRRFVTPAADVTTACRDIIEAVRTRGDEAVLDMTRRFDGVDLSTRGLAVRAEEFRAAEKQVSPAVRQALIQAIANIRRLHETQKPPGLTWIEVAPGVWGGDRTTPIDSVCLYVPRGRGSFSSVMCMLGVPAVVAEVPRIVVCTPPGPDGQVDGATLLAARLLGLERIYRVGGAQAVAAVALGTASIPRCRKFIGPGNAYVSTARQLLADVLDPGPPAGPSESVILCDESADPHNAAWNLLIEAEHGENSCAVLVTHSPALAEAVAAAASAALDELTPQRRAFATEVLERNGGVVLTASLAESLDFVNAFAPEHLAVMVRNPWEVLGTIRNAGEILLGDYPIISLGNYALGVNAILPTGGLAATRSCVSVHDFLKRSSVALTTRGGFESLRGVVSTLSRDEGFCAHHLAVEKWRSEPGGTGQCAQ